MTDEDRREDAPAGGGGNGGEARPEDGCGADGRGGEAEGGIGPVDVGGGAIDFEPGDGPREAPAGPPDWEAEAGRLRDLYLRTLAEAENTRRRFQKEREENSKFASEGVLRDLLPFLDNLNLALSYADESNPAVKSLAQGVAMTLKGCLDKLSEWGLREVGAEIGGAFDPNFQEAIGQEPNPALPDKSVGRLVSKGYTLHGRLLRPARVVVVKNPEPAQA